MQAIRSGVDTMFEKKADELGWFGPGYDKEAEENGLSQILACNEADERLIVGQPRRHAVKFANNSTTVRTLPNSL